MGSIISSTILKLLEIVEERGFNVFNINSGFSGDLLNLILIAGTIFPSSKIKI